MDSIVIYGFLAPIENIKGTEYFLSGNHHLPSSSLTMHGIAFQVVKGNSLKYSIESPAPIRALRITETP